MSTEQEKCGIHEGLAVCVDSGTCWLLWGLHDCVAALWTESESPKK